MTKSPGIILKIIIETRLIILLRIMIKTVITNRAIILFLPRRKGIGIIEEREER